MSIISLIGKTYNGFTYTIHITENEGKVTNIAVAGKPCKAVSDAAKDFSSLKGLAVDVVNAIKLTMITHNEYDWSNN